MDETDLNLHLGKKFGRSKIVKRVYIVTQNSRGQKISIMALMNQEGLKCHRTQIGSYNANLMCQFLVEFCQTRRKITIIFDKVRLHKCESVKQIAESHQCNLFIHPPYSSMLNQKFGIYFQSGIQLLNRYREIVSRHGLINSLEV